MLIIYLKEILGRLGGRRLLFPVAGVFILLVCGISIFSIPAYEVMYNHSLLPVVSTNNSGTLHFHILEIGNTGRKQQQNVDILLSSHALSYQLLPPKAKNFGKVDRKVEITKDDQTTRIALGALEPGKRVEISLGLFYKEPGEEHDWDEIYKGIEIAQGEAIEGNPSWTTLGRTLYRVFGFIF